MRILYLYYVMKLNGPRYHRAQRLTDRLAENHRIDLKYMILPDADYEAFTKTDPGLPELISASQFLSGGYNAVIVDDRISENDSYPYRIPRETLKSFHAAGGIVCFFFGDQDLIRNNRMSLQDLADYLGACNHGHGGLFSSDPAVRIIKGVQHGDSHLEIEITEDYLEWISQDIRCVYNGVGKLVADWAFHLHTASDLLFVGDRKTNMITDGDYYWDGPRPPIFGNISRYAGTTVFLTGHLWKDYINERYHSDNLRFIENVLDLCQRTQREMGYHQHSALIFLSYSHKDTEFVDRLVTALTKRGVEVWRDVKEIRGGESISKKVEEGLRKADCYLLVLSQNSIGSRWVELEYRAALTMSIACNKTDWIIPIITDVSAEQLQKFSLILSDRKYIDFNKGFRNAMAELAESIL